MVYGVGHWISTLYILSRSEGWAAYSRAEHQRLFRIPYLGCIFGGKLMGGRYHRYYVTRSITEDHTAQILAFVFGGPMWRAVDIFLSLCYKSVLCVNTRLYNAGRVCT